MSLALASQLRPKPKHTIMASPSNGVPPACQQTESPYIARLRLSKFVEAQAQHIMRVTGLNYEESSNAPETYLDIKAGFVRALILLCPVLVDKANSWQSIYMSPATNWAFRFWHDYLHYKHDLTFSVVDEMQVNAFHIDAVGREFGVDSLEAKYMTADTNGQTMYFQMHGEHVVNQLAFAHEVIKSTK